MSDVTTVTTKLNRNFSMFTKLYEWLFAPPKIVLPDPNTVAAQQLHETRLDLLKAHKELEYWTRQVPMLVERQDRLMSTLNFKEA